MKNRNYLYNNENIRNENIKKVIASLITGESFSRAELAKKFNLNKATISEIINNLIEDGYIKEVGLGDSTPTGGRKPILLQLNKKAGIICAFEFQYNEYSFMATYLDGEIIFNEKISQDVNKDNIVNIIKSAIESFSEKYNKNKINIIGIGIAIHGVVENNKVIFAPYYDIYKIDIAKEVEQALDIPVSIENESNLFAIFESTVNTKYQNIIAINISSGIGAGIVIKSVLYKGKSGKAGEVGHMILFPHGKKCSCGNEGCFEQYCSKQALLNQYAEITNKSNVCLSDIKYDYDNKVSKVVELMDTYKSNLIIGLNNIINSFSPEALILKSDIFTEFPDLFEDICKVLKVNNENINIALTNWKDFSTLFGAVTLSLQNYFDISSFNLYSR